MRFQAGIQILLIVLSVILVYMVIKPKFTEIAVYQDETAKYAQAIEHANKYNEKLTKLMDERNAISTLNLEALNRFLPPKIQPTEVARDLVTIIESNGHILLDISTEEPISVLDGVSVVSATEGELEEEGAVVMENGLVREARSRLVKQVFVIESIGSYYQMKRMLADMERNAYPLKLNKLEFDARVDGDLYRFNYEVETYALTSTK